MTDTLKSICEQCPRLSNPQLGFIPDDLPRHRHIIERDLHELVAAASAGLEKSVVLLAGSILEALLYSFLLGQAAYIAKRRGSFTFNPNHSLQNYKQIFNRWFSDSLPGAVLPDYIVDFRDLVHINRELASTPGICSDAARSLVRTINTLLGELEGFAGPNTP